MRQNERAAIADAFELFYRNRTGRSPDAREAWLISCLGDALDGDDIHMSDRAKRMLFARYEVQRRFLQQFSTDDLRDPETTAMDSMAELDDRPCLEDVFSETTVRFIEMGALRLAAESQISDSAQPAGSPPEAVDSTGDDLSTSSILVPDQAILTDRPDRRRQRVILRKEQLRIT